MPTKEKLSRLNLFVQLKILKELRLLNKKVQAIADSNNAMQEIAYLRQSELADVKDAIAESGYICI